MNPFSGIKCLWTVKLLLVSGEVISWVTGLLQYSPRHFITLLIVHGNINLWVKGTPRKSRTLIPHKNDDSKVIIFKPYFNPFNSFSSFRNFPTYLSIDPGSGVPCRSTVMTLEMVLMVAAVS